MPLHQLLFQSPTQHEAEIAVAHLEDTFPNAFSSLSYSRTSGTGWEVIAIFHEGQEEITLLPEIETCLGLETGEASIQEVPNQDWIAHSLQNLAPVDCGKFVVYGSHDEPFTSYGRVGIQIDAGLAFGTGHHETTKGCLVLLSDVLKAQHPKKALDLGCGTGVLAIAFVRHSARKAFATDIDSIAVEVALKNGNHNGVSDRIRYAAAEGTRHKLIASNAPFDLVFANILANPLKQMAQAIRMITAPHSSLILSGLLAEQESGVLSAYRMVGFHLKKRCIIGGWSSLLLTRK